MNLIESSEVENILKTEEVEVRNKQYFMRSRSMKFSNNSLYRTINKDSGFKRSGSKDFTNVHPRFESYAESDSSQSSSEDDLNGYDFDNLNNCKSNKDKQILQNSSHTIQESEEKKSLIQTNQPDVESLISSILSLDEQSSSKTTIPNYGDS